MQRLHCIWIILFTLFSLPLQSEVVVCIHGFMRGKGNFSTLAKEFEKRGDSVYRFVYPSKKKYIEEHALSLIDYLREIEQKHPQENVHFVTHSLGGIVLRASLNHPDCPDFAKHGRAVLIAPPNQGATLARKLIKVPGFKAFFGSKAGYQLATYENFEHLGHMPRDLNVLIIAGTMGVNPLIPEVNDGKVALSETLLFTPHDFQTIRAGHSWICMKKSVIEHSYRFIHEN